MKRSITTVKMFAAIWFVAGSTGFAGPYQDLVIRMNPTYYYQLNETDTATGAVDSMGRGPTGTYNGDYDNGPEVGIPGPDFLFEEGRWTETLEWDMGEEIDIIGLGEGNLAHASNNEGHITLGDGNDFATNAMTVSMFARGGGNAQGGDRLFTNNVTDPLTSFQIVVGNDGLVVSTNPTVECVSEDDCGHRSLFFPEEGIEFSNSGADRGLIGEANGWWHIVAATHGDTALERTENIRLWLNGVDRTEDMLPGTVGWGTNTGLAKIGGRRADPSDSTTHSGAQDEVAIWLDRTLTDEEALSLFDAVISDAVSLPGDYDGDGDLDAMDIDALSAAIRGGETASIYDLDGNGTVESADRNHWVDVLRNTWFGDSNLDGEFSSTDFVTVFVPAKYETGQAAGWAEGDWNGDGTFDSSDFVAAFASGGYEKGPRAVNAVPEPASCAMLIAGLIGIMLRRRARN